MKLKSYKVQGYPPIQGFEVSDLADIVVLAGPNGVGKTSLLTSLLTVFQNPGANPNAVAVVQATNSEDGHKEVLGIWLESTEGAKFWLKVISELKNRGVQDILIACCDGLKGFPQAIEAVFPKTVVQTCIVHMIRNSMRFVGWVQRKAVCAELRNVYAAPASGNVDMMPASCHGKEVDALVQLFEARRRVEAERVLQALDATEVEKDVRAEYARLADFLTRDDDQWLRLIPGKAVFQRFASKIAIDPARLKRLYLKAAQGMQPDPFAEVKQIFSDFSTFGAA